MFIIYSNYWNTKHLFTEWSTITQHLVFIMFLNSRLNQLDHSKKLMKVKCFDFVRFEVIWASKEILRLDWAVWIIPIWWLIGMSKVWVGTSTCIGIVWNMNIMTAAECRTIISTRIYGIFATGTVLALGKSFEGRDAVFIHQGEDERIGTGSVACRT